MKNASKPQLSKIFERGEHVTMVLPTSGGVSGRVVIRARVIRQPRWGQFTARVVTDTQQPWAFDVTDRRRNENKTWARGWDTEEAAALHVLEALR